MQQVLSNQLIHEDIDSSTEQRLPQMAKKSLNIHISEESNIMPIATMNKTHETQSTPQNILSIFRAEASPLISLAIPMIAGMVSSVLVGVTDTYFLGPLGEAPLAAVSLTTSISIILYAALYGLLGPVGYLIGTAFGAGDVAKIS